jgi:hypothetical protein
LESIMVELILAVFLGFIFLYFFGVRLSVTFVLCSFFGILISKENLWIQEKQGLSPYPVFVTLAIFGVILALVLTSPARIHLFLIAAAFGAVGFLISRDEIFKFGAGRISESTLVALAAGVALVVAYPRGGGGPKEHPGSLLPPGVSVRAIEQPELGERP